MPRLWIVHREPRTRAALKRLAAAPHDALLGAPGDPAFSSAEPAEVVLLGITEPFEAELEFAHRLAPRLRGATWLVLAERADLQAARRLFDALDVELLAYPPDASALRRRLRDLARRSASQPLPLSQRAVRDALSARFAGWFGDLQLPSLLRTLDPRLSDVPVLVRGEPGTGRGNLARYIHSLGGGAEGAFLQVACAPGHSSSQLFDAIATTARAAQAASGAAICLLGVDRLEPAVQRELLDWIEFGPPSGLLRARPVRWMATADDDPGDDRLNPALLQALAGFSLRIPPLRERMESIPGLVRDAAARFCAAHGERARAFGEDAMHVLTEYPWPGNLRELESVVVQSLAASASDPLEPADLERDGEAFAPLDADSIGVVLLDADELMPDFAPAPEPEPARPTPIAAAPPMPEPLLPRTPPDTGMGPLAAALAHELRNPLTGIRTFSELLAERWSDPEFRARFAERAAEDVRHIEDSLELLTRVADFGRPVVESVDITALLAELLEAHRDQVRERRLLVLQELETQRPEARGDPEQIRFALDAVLGACFALVPERGDLYLASKHHAAGLRGGPSLRVLVRFQGPQRASPAGRVPGVTPAENSLALVLAERVVEAQQGSFTLNQAQGGETLLILDLPA